MAAGRCLIKRCLIRGMAGIDGKERQKDSGEEEEMQKYEKRSQKSYTLQERNMISEIPVTFLSQ